MQKSSQQGNTHLQKDKRENRGEHGEGSNLNSIGKCMYTNNIHKIKVYSNGFNIRWLKIVINILKICDQAMIRPVWWWQAPIIVRTLKCCQNNSSYYHWKNMCSYFSINYSLLNWWTNRFHWLSMSRDTTSARSATEGGPVSINMWGGVNSINRTEASWNNPSPSGIKLWSAASKIDSPIFKKQLASKETHQNHSLGAPV